MSADGTVEIRTKLDNSDVKKKMSKMESVAKAGLSGIVSAGKIAAKIAAASVAGVTAAMGGAVAMGISRVRTRRLAISLWQVSENSPPNRTYTSQRIRLSRCQSNFPACNLS